MLAIYIIIVPTDGFSIAIVMYGFGLIVVSFLLRKKLKIFSYTGTYMHVYTCVYTHTSAFENVLGEKNLTKYIQEHFGVRYML